MTNKINAEKEIKRYCKIYHKSYKYVCYYETEEDFLIVLSNKNDYYDTHINIKVDDLLRFIRENIIENI